MDVASADGRREDTPGGHPSRRVGRPFRRNGAALVARLQLAEMAAGPHEDQHLGRAYWLGEPQRVSSQEPSHQQGLAVIGLRRQRGLVIAFAVGRGLVSLGAIEKCQSYQAYGAGRADWALALAASWPILGVCSWGSLRCRYSTGPTVTRT
ncbi:hypothetical protein XACS582_13560006 [Xanthomonas citri pv. citri]|nr:hypothetical protein XAC3824_190050 [Xanthomonas citri pv. citri]CEE28079.1 hypothetical protein XAC902_1730005 [Xanthomonas citri pv. citri]CEE54249.1 hypothetical protein XAC71A_230050 [Xanthomonas citri pv. citri]CEE57448.1 hypothetical protein XACS584_1720017 [Xanthomonas citri pv. citri]CEE79272.1 hypothetical protein XACLE20_1810002 [Xanthomonas citri pv. citri]